MLPKDKRICPCCGKRLELIPPSRELQPSTTGFSTNGVVYYFAPAKRYFRVTSHPSAVPQGGQNNDWHFEGRLSPNFVQFDKSHPGWHIVPLNYAKKRLKRDGLFLFSNELIFHCKHCNQRLTLNVNPMNWFELVFLIWLLVALFALCAVTFIATTGNESVPDFLEIILIASTAIMGVDITITATFMVAVKRRESNFVPTDEDDSLIYPPIDIKLSASLRSPYLREGNVLTAKLADGEVHIYLVRKAENYEFSICCEDGERERLKQWLSECGKLELTFEGKPVGAAKISEVIR